MQDNARKLISKIIEATQPITVAAGDIFAWGGGKSPNDGHGQYSFVSHALNTVITFSDQKG